MSNLPVVIENGIPIALFEATTVDASNPSIDAIHTYLVWPKPNDGAIPKVGTMSLSVFTVGKANP